MILLFPFHLALFYDRASLVARGKESTCQCRRRGFNPWVGKMPWRRKWQPTLVFLHRGWTEESGGLRFTGSQRVRHDGAYGTSTQRAGERLELGADRGGEALGNARSFFFFFLTGVGCHFLLQGIFLTQGSTWHLLHWQTDSLPLNHQGNPSVTVINPFQFLKILIGE